MANLTSVEDLLNAWSRVALTPDPLAALTAEGHTVAPPLLAELKRERPRRLSPEQRTQLLERLKSETGREAELKALRFTVRPKQTVIARELPPGEFDVVVSVRLEVANQLLAGLFATHAWPHRFAPGTVPLPISRIRELSDNVPDVEGLEVGALHLTAAPTVEVGPGGAVRLAQTVRLDVDLIRDTFPRRTTVTSLSAMFRYDARPRAEESAPGEVTIELDVAAAQGTEELEIASDSAIQPRDANALQAFTSFVVPLLAFAIRQELVGRSVSLTPGIRLPFDQSVAVRILAARTGTGPTQSGLGVVHAGIRVGFGDDATTPAVPDTVTLDPFGQSPLNVVISVHEATLHAVAMAAVPALERNLRDKIPIPVRAKSASTELKPPDTLRLSAACSFPDYCGPGPVNFIDLDFDVTMDAELTVIGGRIRSEGDPETNFDNSDLALCALSALVDFAVLAIVDVIVSAVKGVGLIWGFNTAGVLEERTDDFTGVFDPRTPIPFTELVPRAEVLQAQVTEDRLMLRGILVLTQATEHIFAYIKVREGAPGVLSGPPIEGARVQVLDQDAPSPEGDDFTPPTLETPVILNSPTKTIRIDRTFEPARRDEVMGTATTNKNGLARLVFARSGGRGGTIVTRTITRLKNQEKEPTVEFSQSPAFEELPDAYIRVILADGRKFDSRNSTEIGLLVDLESTHIGTADSPVNVRILRNDPTQPL